MVTINDKTARWYFWGWQHWAKIGKLDKSFPGDQKPRCRWLWQGLCLRGFQSYNHNYYHHHKIIKNLRIIEHHQIPSYHHRVHNQLYLFRLQRLQWEIEVKEKKRWEANDGSNLWRCVLLIDFIIVILGDCTSNCGRGKTGCSPVQVHHTSIIIVIVIVFFASSVLGYYWSGIEATFKDFIQSNAECHSITTVSKDKTQQHFSYMSKRTCVPWNLHIRESINKKSHKAADFFFYHPK